MTTRPRKKRIPNWLKALLVGVGAVSAGFICQKYPSICSLITQFFQ